jgi:3',5'-cyclic AMP phosphodiesterase CpdA
MATSLLHLADLHNDPRIVDKLKMLKEKYPSDLLLITGDLTNDGEGWQYEMMWRTLMQNYGIPPWDWAGHIGEPYLYVLPGNHDARKAGICFWRREGIRRFDATFGTKFYGLNEPMVNVFEDDKAVLIRLDSNCENWNWSLACGRVGRKQLRCLDKLLDQYRGYNRIVALHHHPFDRGLGRALLDSDKFMAVVKDRCEVLCFGHKHKFERCSGEEQYYGIPHILAAGALFEENRCWQIVSDKGTLSVNELVE